MAEIPLGPVVRAFDHHDCPGIGTDPFTAFDNYRHEPIFWSPAHGGFWVLTRFEDIRAVLRDTVTFSSKYSTIPAVGWPRPLMPIELDAPRHARIRLLVTRSLTGATGSAIAEAIQRECVRLADQLAPRGMCDLVVDYARPVQNVLFTSLFDVPAEHLDAWSGWVADLPQHIEPPRRARALAAIVDYIAERIAQIRARSNSAGSVGLLSALARADLDRPLEDDEILDIAFMTMLGTVYTLSNTIAFSFRHLAEYPEQQDELAADPSLARSAVDELLRLYSVANGVRTATHDTVLAGVPIRAGDRVLVCIPLANRDPTVYPDPAALRYDRPANPGHITFGYGPHRCLGARIAVHALTAALGEWHRRIPSYAISRSAEIRTGGGSVCTIDALPLIWQP